MDRRYFLRTATLLTGSFGLHGCSDPAAPEDDSKKPRKNEPLKVCLCGDTHAGYEGSETMPPAETIHRRILGCFQSYKPNIICHLGDHIHNLGTDQWTQFDALTADIRASARYYPVFGNHDPGDGGIAAYLDFFNGNMPNNGGDQLYYWVRHDHVLFVVLDVHDSQSTSHQTQKTWLENILVEHEDALFKFVLFHIPPWTTGGRGPFPYARAFNATCKDRGVDMVINGHIHAYERFLIDGMNYVVTGGGGGFGCSQETRFAHCLDTNSDTASMIPFRKAAAEMNNFVHLEISRHEATLTAYDLDENEIDRFSITKELDAFQAA
ncbi:MAG: metallophosphoesterase [bacterium]